MPLPKESFKAWQFPQSSVIFKCEHSAAVGKVLPRLEVMCIDQYRYQRELLVYFNHHEGKWEYHAYRHPGRHHIGHISERVAMKFMERFLEQVEKYPGLLFNDTGDHAADKSRPRCEGFVHLSERLLDGGEFTVKQLD